jgi:hypothetical protein
MKRMSIVVMALCVIGLSACATAMAGSTVNGDVKQTQNNSVDVGVNLNFRGWYPWGDLEAAPVGNTVTLNGRVNTAGYVNEHLDKAMKNKSVLLEIRNAAASKFSEDRMFKITVNKNDQLVRPIGINDLANGEYIPPEYNKVEFVLPNDFDGKLGFVFYQADLRGLQITARYK